MTLMRLKGLMKFAQHVNHDDSLEEGEIREELSSPVQSSSPDLFFSRLNSEIDEQDDGYFSTCSSSSSTSSLSSTHSIDRSLRRLHLDSEVARPSIPHSSISTDSIAVFDTSALIDHPDILDIALTSKVIAVIPYKVLQELDGLKKSSRDTVVRAVAKVHHSLDVLSYNNNPMLILESGRELDERLNGFVAETSDEKILKCAMKIMDSKRHQMRNIWVVTNDKNLRLKTRGRDLRFVGTHTSTLKAVGSQEFVRVELLKQRIELLTGGIEKKTEPQSSDSSHSSTTSIRPPKRKGLSMVDANSAPVSKRIRCEKEKEGEKEEKEENRLIECKDELLKAHFRLAALESISERSLREMESHVVEVKMRKRLLGSFKRVLQRKLEKSKANKMVRTHA